MTGSTIREEGTGTTSKGKMKSGDYVINVNWKMQGNTGTGLTSTGMMMRDAVSHPIRV